MASVIAQTPFQQYVGNGVTTVFPYEFTLLDAADLVVTVDGVVIAPASFTLTGVGVQTGGTVIFAVAPAAATSVLLSRTIALARATDYQVNGDLRADVVDDDFNRLWQAMQGLNAQLSSVLRLPYPEPSQQLPSKTARALKLLGADVNGDIIFTLPTPGDATALALDLLNNINAAKGAGQVGFGDVLSYPANTLGKAVVDLLPRVTTAERPSLRNKVINGSFDVWQRATSFSSGLATATYTADRWVVFAAGAAVTVSQNAGNGFTAGTDALILTGAASNTYVDIRQRFEAREVQKWKNGNVTVSARFYNNTGSTISANSLTFTVSTPTVTDNWAGSVQRLGTTFTHAAIPNASWGYLTVTFNPSGYTDISKGMDIGLRVTALLAGQAVNWSEVQLETGASASAFESIPIATTLQLCQRFFYRLGGFAGVDDIVSGVFTSATEFRFVLRHPQRMRGSPAVTTAGTISNFQAVGAATYAASAFTLNVAGVDSINGSFTVSGATAGQAGYARINNVANTISVNAELV